MSKTPPEIYGGGAEGAIEDLLLFCSVLLFSVLPISKKKKKKGKRKEKQETKSCQGLVLSLYDLWEKEGKLILDGRICL